MDTQTQTEKLARKPHAGSPLGSKQAVVALAAALIMSAGSIPTVSQPEARPEGPGPELPTDVVVIQGAFEVELNRTLHLTNDTVVLADEIKILGDIFTRVGPNGDGVTLNLLAQNGPIVIEGNVRTASGASPPNALGAGSVHADSGGKGGDLVLSAWAAEPTDAFIEISRTGSLILGDGGDGGAATVHGKGSQAWGGDGGNGGSLMILGSPSLINRGVVEMGAGGDGGPATSIGSTADRLAVGGDGGDSGSLKGAFPFQQTSPYSRPESIVSNPGLMWHCSKGGNGANAEADGTNHGQVTGADGDDGDGHHLYPVYGGDGERGDKGPDGGDGGEAEGGKGGKGCPGGKGGDASAVGGKAGHGGDGGDGQDAAYKGGNGGRGGAGSDGGAGGQATGGDGGKGVCPGDGGDGGDADASGGKGGDGGDGGTGGSGVVSGIPGPGGSTTANGGQKGDADPGSGGAGDGWPCYSSKGDDGADHSSSGAPGSSGSSGGSQYGGGPKVRQQILDEGILDDNQISPNEGRDDHARNQ